MESLAKLVAFMLLTTLTSGPLAIALTLITDKNLLLKILRRILHGVLVMASLLFALIFSVNSEIPPAINLIGLFAFIMAYIALRREYFPDFRIIDALLSKLGLRKNKAGKTNVEGIEGQNSKDRSSRNPSPFGPLMKWRRNGSSGGDDGHGPEGQH